MPGPWLPAGLASNPGRTRCGVRLREARAVTGGVMCERRHARGHLLIARVRFRNAQVRSWIARVHLRLVRQLRATPRRHSQAHASHCETHSVHLQTLRGDIHARNIGWGVVRVDGRTRRTHVRPTPAHRRANSERIHARAMDGRVVRVAWRTRAIHLQPVRPICSAPWGNSRARHWRATSSSPTHRTSRCWGRTSGERRRPRSSGEAAAPACAGALQCGSRCRPVSIAAAAALRSARRSGLR